MITGGRHTRSRIVSLLPATLASVSALISLWSVRAPGSYLGSMLLAVVFWALAGTLWLALPVRRAVTRLLRRPAPGTVNGPRPYLSWSLLTPPLLVVLTALAVHTHFVERMTFQLHRGALEQLVLESANTPGRLLSRERRIGVYEVSRVHPEGPCTKVSLASGGLFTSGGFAYCPATPPIDDQSNEGTRYQPLDGPWYTFAFTW